MKYTYKEYRQKAWDSLTGKWGAAALLMLVYLAITAVISSISSPGSAGLSWKMIFVLLDLALLPMAFVLAKSFLEVAKGDDMPKVKALFEPYKDKDTCLRFFLVEFWKGLFTFLWSLLLIVPGIIKGYAYAMSEYIAAENPDIDPRDALKKSQEMMYGHKWELFVLDLTFIGWFLLSLLTAGLLMLMVAPYINTAHAHFYLSLKEEQAPAAETSAKAEYAATPETSAPVEGSAKESAEAKPKAKVEEEPKAEEHADDEPKAGESSEK